MSPVRQWLPRHAAKRQAQRPDIHSGVQPPKVRRKEQQTRRNAIPDFCAPALKNMRLEISRSPAACDKNAVVRT
jgi:hypothetical protein